MDEFDFLAGFKVEAFALDDDAAINLVCLAHIETSKAAAALHAPRQLLNALRRGPSPRI